MRRWLGLSVLASLCAIGCRRDERAPTIARDAAAPAEHEEIVPKEEPIQDAARAVPSPDAGAPFLVDEIERIIRDSRPNFRACWKDRDASVVGTLSFGAAVTINPSGKVSSVTMENVGDAGASPVVACIKRELESLRFPASDGVHVTHVPFKFVTQ